jgi:hypothetical protein
MKPEDSPSEHPEDCRRWTIHYGADSDRDARHDCIRTDGSHQEKTAGRGNRSLFRRLILGRSVLRWEVLDRHLPLGDIAPLDSLNAQINRLLAVVHLGIE